MKANNKYDKYVVYAYGRLRSAFDSEYEAVEYALIIRGTGVDDVVVKHEVIEVVWDSKLFKNRRCDKREAV